MNRCGRAGLGLLLVLTTAAVADQSSLPRQGSVPAARRPGPARAAVEPTRPELEAPATSRREILRLHLASAPFPDPARRVGFRYRNAEYPANPHYVDSSVAVLIPPGFFPDGPVNLVFFFHGWNSSIDDAQKRFDLYRQFSQSHVQALLVLPELAWNAPDSYGGKLERAGGFARMVHELLENLHARGRIATARVGTIALAGHSGAYRVIAEILEHGDLAAAIREVWLFDALYACTGRYAAWIREDRGRFVSVSAADGFENTDVDGLIARLRAGGVPFELARDEADGAQDLQSRVLFLMSDTDHYGVVADHEEFRRLLQASPELAPCRPDWSGPL
jgi:hypothetical protein